MTTTPLDFIARPKAEPGCETTLHATRESFVAPTRSEPANENHRPRNGGDPTRFAIYEDSTGRSALGTHFDTPHPESLIAAADRLVAEHGTDGKPFTAGPLAMVTGLSPTGA